MTARVFPRPLMQTERQARFREAYRNNIHALYNGLVHIGVIYAVGIGLIGYCARQLVDPGWAWLVVLPVALATNLGEWAMHKYVMHRLIDVFALRAIYDRHTRQHHQYFTDTDYTIDRSREFRIVFFPWRVLTVLAIGGGAIGYLAAQAFGTNVGYIVFMTMVGHYLLYEFMHYCCHVKENRFVRSVPFVNTIRRHHAAHHNLGIMMHKNMNLTFPIADWYMGTSDVKRGLLGTLLNGYEEAFIDPKLRPIVAKFRDGRVQQEQVTLEGPRLSSEESATLAA